MTVQGIDVSQCTAQQASVQSEETNQMSTSITLQLQNRNLLKNNFITNYTVHSVSVH